MQIRLVIGEQDSRYLNNLVLYLEKNHMDKLEIFSFSKPEMLQVYLKDGVADIILVGEDFGINAETLSSYGTTAYLTDGEGSNVSDNVRKIAKFKKPDLIYKDILDLYAEGGKRQIFRSNSQKTGHITLVTGVSGGTGSSTFAAALAKKYALRGKKVLYLNMEPTGMASDFFDGVGDYHFEDVIFALKSRRTDVRLKMESAVRTDPSGVHFFEPCTNSMYMLELTHEDIMKLINTLESGLGYDNIIVDMNFRLTKEFMEIMGHMHRIILVQDGGETSNSKFERTMEALQIMEEKDKTNVTGVMCLLYNRFSSSKSSSEIKGLRIPVIGKYPPVKHAYVKEIIQFMLEKQEVFDNL